MMPKYKIYGITYGKVQDTKTEQYMIVLDYYFNKRDISYGMCEQCERPNTNPKWCQSCDPSKESHKYHSSSGNTEIDNCITNFQLKATAYEKVIEWVPFKKLSNIKEIGRGGFGIVYLAIWLGGKRTVEKIGEGYKQSRRIPYVVALKTLPGSKSDASEFLNEFKTHMECRLEGIELEIYGLTQNEKDEYLMVFQYANRGSLYEFLTQNFSELTWQKKLEQLEYISNDLHRIHSAGFIHSDFHSNNILLNQNIDGKIKSYIADLGLSRKKDDGSKDEICGIMPYVAPEVLSGKEQFTQAADQTWRRNETYPKLVSEGF
ncbi:kinase-like domain-containing protein [Gigaspora rosea]|uniref:Kinase-like domain-containing protein n=1 Tax=Gigaspora rosea TaxID=44941 RepID=A0A397V585_9GLOM|nr:kinase-like domain-containing protein [Gigaspora rosea]